MPTLQTAKYTRKPFHVEAVQVTEVNLKDIALWASGSIGHDDDGTVFIKVKVHRALNERQSKAYIGDWVLKAGAGHKVFTDKAFKQNFTLTDKVTGVQPSKNAKLEAEITLAQSQFVEVTDEAIVLP